MQRNRLKIILIFLLSVTFSGVYAQLEEAGIPWTKEHNIPVLAALPITLPDVPDNWQEQVFENEPSDLKPFLFAWPVDTSLNLVVNKFKIYDTQDWLVYQTVIRASKAFSINVIFDRFYLPDGAQLFLYNREYTSIRGAYTSKNNKSFKQLATSPVEGNEIFIELIIDKNQMTFSPELSIGRISLDMENAFGEKSGHFGRSGDCNVDINCPPGSDWQVTKRSVAKFIRGGSFLCSGALINNTSNDGKPYLLTAHHTIGSEEHARLSVFYFNYESPECMGGDGSTQQSISGSQLLATTNKLDFALVALTIEPPESYAPYYAGWDRNPVVFYDTVTGIHHPRGDVKKISASNRRVATGDWGTSFDANTHWYITEWDMGTTEPGSSGSPLFNQNQRIIGDLTGGDASCSYNHNDYYQKFWVCWDRYPDSTEQLKYWLDSNGVDATVWNGYDPFLSGKPQANYTIRPASPVAGKFIRFVDVSSGAPQNWQWSFPGATPEESYDRNPLAFFETPGVKSVRLIVSNDLGTDTIEQRVLIQTHIDFEATHRRLVAGANTKFLNLSTPTNSSLHWEITEGVQTWVSYDVDAEQTFNMLGSHDVKLSLTYDDIPYSYFHQNCIYVGSEKIIFSGDILSAYTDQELIQIYELGNYGFIPGTNSLGYSAFANEFTHHSDTTLLITGIRLDVLKLIQVSESTSITTVLWDAEWNEIKRQDIQLNPKSMPFRATSWFDDPVGMDSLVYAGFLLPDSLDMILSSGMTLTRNESGKNQAWGKIDDQWRPLNQSFGLNSAIGVQLEVSYLFQKYADQIQTRWHPESNQLDLLLNELVYSKIFLDVYTISGQKVSATYEGDDQMIRLNIPYPVTGIYLLNVRIDHIQFTKKVLITKN